MLLFWCSFSVTIHRRHLQLILLSLALPLIWSQGSIPAHCTKGTALYTGVYMQENMCHSRFYPHQL